MQFALVGSDRREAFSQGKGLCPTCGADMVAKCGPRVIHHWAHAHKQNCDPWWENETQWHRDWKNLFPAEWREIAHVASDGEIHRADVKTPHGLVLELQHSSISDGERLSREKFYGNMLWVLDGRDFVKNFDILHQLPDPSSVLAKDIVWIKGTRQLKGAASGIFARLSENPGATKSKEIRGIIHFMYEIQEEVERSYIGHHQFDWVRPRQAWLESGCPVYIDFGWPLLVRLEKYDEYRLPCIRLLQKSDFVADALRVARTTDICC